MLQKNGYYRQHCRIDRVQHFQLMEITERANKYDQIWTPIFMKQMIQFWKPNDESIRIEQCPILDRDWSGHPRVPLTSIDCAIPRLLNTTRSIPYIWEYAKDNVHGIKLLNFKFHHFIVLSKRQNLFMPLIVPLNSVNFGQELPDYLVQLTHCRTTHLQFSYKSNKKWRFQIIQKKNFINKNENFPNFDDIPETCDVRVCTYQFNIY